MGDAYVTPQTGARRSWCCLPAKRGSRHFPVLTRRPDRLALPWTYDVGIFGVVVQLAIYELDPVSTSIDQAPGLIGADGPYFTDDTIEVFGRRGRITPVALGHPCISLLGLPESDMLGETEVREPDHQEGDRSEVSVECRDEEGEEEPHNPHVMYEQYLGAGEQEYEGSRSTVSEPEDLRG